MRSYHGSGMARFDRRWRLQADDFLRSCAAHLFCEKKRYAQAFVKAAPERLVWGSDWPHPGEQNRTLPDDALLFDLLAVWAPDEATRKRILVDNPENLYGFAKSA